MRAFSVLGNTPTRQRSITSRLCLRRHQRLRALGKSFCGLQLHVQYLLELALTCWLVNERQRRTTVCVYQSYSTTTEQHDDAIEATTHYSCIFEFNAVSWPRFAEALRNARNLRLLQLSRVDWKDPSASSSTITLGSLTDLHLTYSQVAAIVPLRLLDMPKLTLLHLHLFSDTLAVFTPMFEHALANVRILELRLLYVTPSSLNAFLGKMQRLTQLDVTRSAPEVFPALMLGVEESDLVLTRLEQLTVGCVVTKADLELLFLAIPRPVADNFVMYETLADMVVQKWKSTAEQNGFQGCRDTVEYVGLSIAEQWLRYERWPSMIDWEY
ncbi:hypothetical protein B0H12DRAFT_1229077 [Mycena haematopus]|nr:hypothetical protein B0H12DRAFT_1229077 [Mycena haematopus]